MMSPVFTKTASENDHFGFYKVDHDDAALAAVISEQGITAVSTVQFYASPYRFYTTLIVSVAAHFHHLSQGREGGGNERGCTSKT